MFAGSDLSNNVVPDPTAYAQVNMTTSTSQCLVGSLYT